MRIFAAVTAAVMMALAAPAFAQSADPGRAERMELADRYLQITMGQDLRKYIAAQMEESYSESDLPPDQRAWLTQNMATAFEEVMRNTIRDLRDDVADRFTTEELQAAIAFYDTPMGRSISRKSVELGGDMQEAMMPHLMEAITGVGEKYCARFDCGAMGQAGAKQGR